MGVKALSLQGVDSIFVMEAYNQHLLFLLPMLATTGKNIFICMHGNQQFASESKIKALGLIYLKNYLKLFKNFKAVLLELDDSFVETRYRFPERSTVVIPHPTRGDVEPKYRLGERPKPEAKIKIGVIGIIRQGKPIEKILARLQNYVAEHSETRELIIGTPSRQKPEYLNHLDNISIYDTTSDRDYLNLLKELDILVTDLDREQYYYRASGVISDAASAGCYVIAPDYPVIKHQITWPVSVGDTFSDLAELDGRLDTAIERVKMLGNDHHWKWREKRSAESIAKHLFSSLNQ
jgi:hypothetical protein